MADGSHPTLEALLMRLRAPTEIVELMHANRDKIYAVNLGAELFHIATGYASASSTDGLFYSINHLLSISLRITNFHFMPSLLGRRD
jgi:hypothetical protein